MTWKRDGGYYEYEIGWRNTGLAYNGNEIARTDGDVVFAYDPRHQQEIEEWAEENDCSVEWIPSDR